MLTKSVQALFLLCIGLAAAAGLAFLFVTTYIERDDPLASAPSGTRFADVAGERLAYSEIDNGSDTTVLFVGGLSAWNGTWQRVIDVQNARTKRFNYVALDLPPFGYSSPEAARGYFRDAQADRIAAFVEKKKFKKLILAGHSYGAGPITEFAMRHPERVQKLILIDAVLNAGEDKSVPSFSPVRISPLRTGAVGLLIHSDAIVLNRLKSFVYVTDHIDPDLAHLYTRYFNTRGVASRLSQWVRDYSLDPLRYKSTDVEEYKKLQFPVRLIWGDKDTLTPISGAQALLPIVPDISLRTLENVGHIPMIENYAAFDGALSDALDK